MAALSNDEIRALLEPYVAPFEAIQLSDSLIGQVSEYLDLLIRWNARISLTAIRRPGRDRPAALWREPLYCSDTSPAG